MAKYLDENGLLYYDGKIKGRLANKVDKVDGKGLSTNDYTDDDKTKLTNIASGAQVNVIESVSVNGTPQTVTNKSIDITMPTDTGDLTNNAGYITSAAITGKEDTTNKTTTITSSSTDTQYPSAKATYTELNKKVDKVSGKGLSTNDFTNDDKSKLDNIDSRAQVNTIEKIKVNGTELAITGKAVDITVPTDNNQLANGKGYQNATEVQALIDSAIEGITGIDFKIVESLPEEGEKGVIYLMAHSHTTSDIYDEYIWLSASRTYEKIGSTDIDLSGYWSKTELTSIQNTDIDTIVSKVA